MLAVQMQGPQPPLRLLYGTGYRGAEPSESESIPAILLTIVGVPIAVALTVWLIDQSSPTKTAQRRRARLRR